MTKKIKGTLCVFLSLAIMFSFASCANNKMTEENVTATVDKVETALKEFDVETLEKYVDSQTLKYIVSFAKDHDQFVKLGQAMFKDLTMDIDSINLEAKTVTVNVKNKNLVYGAAIFTSQLLKDYSKLQLLSQLNNDTFLNNNLTTLIGYIDDAKLQDKSVKIVLKITQGKKNLVLSFDEDAENAVSGGAFNAIKTFI